jgi:hypothetical protein
MDILDFGAQASPGYAHRGGVRFDATINLGHVLTAAASLITIVAGWMTLSSAQQQQRRDIDRNEQSILAAMPRVEAMRIEAVLVDKIAGVRANLDQTNIRTAGDIHEIKDILVRIDEKLDRKADKPGIR